MFFPLGIALHIILCILVGVYWNSKGRSWIVGAVLSWFLSPIIGGIVGAVLQPRHEKLGYRKTSSNYRACPECHHLVKSSLVRCDKCYYVFGSNLYEELRERLLGVDDIRHELVNHYQYESPRLDEKLKRFQYDMLNLPDDIVIKARNYSYPQLQRILKDFPPRDEVEQATVAQTKLLAQSIECPHCHTLQSRDNLMCSECYTDLKRLNPDTGEIESVDVEWADEQK